MLSTPPHAQRRRRRRWLCCPHRHHPRSPTSQIPAAALSCRRQSKAGQLAHRRTAQGARRQPLCSAPLCCPHRHHLRPEEDCHTNSRLIAPTAVDGHDGLWGGSNRPLRASIFFYYLYRNSNIGSSRPSYARSLVAPVALAAVVVVAALVVGALICADVGLVDCLLVLVRLARRVVAIEERLVASEVVAPPAALVTVRRVEPAVAILGREARIVVAVPTAQAVRTVQGGRSGAGRAGGWRAGVAYTA